MSYRRLAFAFTLLLSTALMTRLLRGAEPTPTAPPAAPAATPASQPAARSMQDIMNDMRTVSMEAKDVFSPAMITDPAKRKELAPKALPTLKKMIALGKELQATPNKQLGDQILSQLRPMAALLGDQETVAELEKQAKSANADEATAAKASLLLSRY